MNSKLVASLCFAASIAACGASTSSKLSPEGAQVRYADEELDAAQCHALGEVHTDPAPTSGTLGEQYLADEQAAARNRLRNETARLGGNAVFVDEKAHPHLSMGKAYRCGG